MVEVLIEEPLHLPIEDHIEGLVDDGIDASPCSLHGDEDLVSSPILLTL